MLRKKRAGMREENSIIGLCKQSYIWLFYFERAARFFIKSTDFQIYPAVLRSL